MRFWPWTQPPKPAQVNKDYGQYEAYSILLDRNGQWIGVADTKAGVILGFLVAVFPVLAAPAFPAMQEVVKAIPRNADWWAYLPAAVFILLLVLFLVAAFVTLIRVLLALTPRLTRQGKPGHIFFSDIATSKYEQWQQHICALDPQELALEVLEQVYATAYIADRKHKHVRQAIRAMIATVFLGLVLYVLSRLIG